MDTDEQIKAEALKYVEENLDVLVSEIVNGDSAIVPVPISFFMAGSPGAGKTETVKDVLRTFVLPMLPRIDPDLIRDKLPMYTGGNAHLFQQAVTKVVNRTVNHCISKSKHFILDGTFSHYDLARQNVTKSLSKKRKVVLMFVYQNPLTAWKFTQAREAKEGRRITKDIFIDRFIKARENVNAIKEEFGDKVSLYVLDHNLETGYYQWYIGAESVDSVITDHYTREQLESLIL